jgi:predicted ATPase/class 3 adenylate cyclase
MPDFPSGTVTFLFTDIEGSTLRWQQDPTAMAQAVARHLTLLRDAASHHGGVLFKVVGDATQSAFPTAPAALAAALAAQQTLQAEPWSEPIHDLPVRIALHTAEAQPDPRGDYLASGLNRLARLLDAGHGGQVLLSLATQELARDALPSDAELRDLGEHPLRDLYRPERVFQLVHPDLRNAFPLLRTLATRPNNLPIQSTPFLGHVEDIARLTALLQRDDVRVVTITGPGGVGKTRAALQVAANLLDVFPDGVWFVDLSPFVDPDLVPAAVLAVLGARDDVGDPNERLVSVLAGKHVLLVLDNVEQIVSVAAVIGPLLAGAAGTKILATSRTPLHVYGEQEFPIAPLPLPDLARLPSLEALSQYDAVRLFVDRAQAVKPDFAITVQNAQAVAEICARVDGLPLAIELAAARVKVLPPRALLQRLDRRLPLLTGGARTLPLRQQTMRDTVAWSYGLLAPDEQVLFRRLGVFIGGCTLEAAEAVVGEGSLDVFGGIATLIDASLLRQDERGGETRFRMLETIREFAQEQLSRSPGEAEASRQAHARWCQALATSLAPAVHLTGDLTSLTPLTAERDNLLAALAWLADRGDAAMFVPFVAAMAWFWDVTAAAGEGVKWLERALGLDDAGSPETRIDLLNSLGLLLIQLGEAQRTTVVAEELRALARKHTDLEGEANALFLLSRAANQRESYAEAMTFAEQALTRFRTLPSSGMLPWALQRLGIEAYIGGDFARSAALHEEALALCRASDHRVGISFALTNLGLAYHRMGDRRRAAELYREGLLLAQGPSDQWQTAGLLDQLAFLAADVGDQERMARLTGATEGFYQRTGTARQPYMRDALATAEPATRTRLGSAAFTAAYDAGRGLPLDQAVAEALTMVDTIVAFEGEPPSHLISLA